MNLERINLWKEYLSNMPELTLHFDVFGLYANVFDALTIRGHRYGLNGKFDAATLLGFLNIKIFDVFCWPETFRTHYSHALSWEEKKALFIEVIDDFVETGGWPDDTEWIDALTKREQ